MASSRYTKRLFAFGFTYVITVRLVLITSLAKERHLHWKDGSGSCLIRSTKSVSGALIAEMITQKPQRPITH